MRRVVLAAVSTIAGLIMLLSFKTHDVAVLTAPPAALGEASPATSTPTTSAPGTAAAGAAPTTTTPKSTSSATVTVTGSAAATRYGPVEVRITVSNGRVTAVEAVEYPTASARDRSINARAIPQLNSEAMIAQSARIDMVSGATYTSRGYLTSLQSALDQAGLA